ncbi:MAG: hypothetical protein AAF125_27300 [Chloroflexota bacterium]
MSTDSKGVITMQITRHWRLNSQRYRLEGVRYNNGQVSLQERPQPVKDTQVEQETLHEVQVEHRAESSVQKLAS